MKRTMKLGTLQRSVLDALQRHRGQWHEGCGWAVGAPSTTRRTLESLVARGLVDQHEATDVRGERFVLNAAGRAAAAVR